MSRRAALALAGVLVSLAACTAPGAGDPSAAPTPSTPATASATAEATPTPSASPTPQAPAAFDLAALAQGDYTSAQGTWASPGGGQLVITPTTIEWTEKGKRWASLDGLAVDDVGAGEPLRASDRQEQTTMLQWGYSVGGFSHGSLLAFYPVGTPSTDVLRLSIPSDASIQRIIALPGNGVGRLLPTDGTPYVMVRSDAAASAESAAPSSEAEPTAEADPDACRAPAEGAYPCAGGQLPAHATPASAIISGYGLQTAILRSPTQNIGCAITKEPDGATNLECDVSSWSDNAPVAPTDHDPEIGYPSIRFGDGSAPPSYGGTKGDPPCHAPGACPGEDGRIVQPQIVQYGEVVHFGGFACASESTGMTCWNLASGHGAYFSRANFKTF
ncbi:MAG: hypothetical protein Q4F65_12275 [Propionibacteriaceae bacterium]|nr:hypothetical protein [Propionibacteriaceae bacterium]